MAWLASRSAYFPKSLFSSLSQCPLLPCSSFLNFSCVPASVAVLLRTRFIFFTSLLVLPILPAIVISRPSFLAIYLLVLQSHSLFPCDVSLRPFPPPPFFLLMSQTGRYSEFNPELTSLACSRSLQAGHCRRRTACLAPASLLPCSLSSLTQCDVQLGELAFAAVRSFSVCVFCFCFSCFEGFFFVCWVCCSFICGSLV